MRFSHSYQHTHNPHISGHYKSHIHTTKRRQEIAFTYRLLLSFCISFFLSLGSCTKTTMKVLLYWLGFLCISEIIDDLTQLVDKTDSRIKNETHRVKLLETKSASWGECSATVSLVLCTPHQEPGNNKPVHRSDLRPSLSLSLFFSLLRLEQSSELNGLKLTACKWQIQICTLWSVSVLWALTGPSACDLWVCYWSSSEIRLRRLERSFAPISGKLCKTLSSTSEYFLLWSNLICL